MSDEIIVADEVIHTATDLTVQEAVHDHVDLDDAAKSSRRGGRALPLTI